MATQKAPATPSDSPTPPSAIKHPTKGKRYRVLGQGEGDYCVYQIAPDGGQIPKGSLIPIPDVPRFPSQAEAMKWIRHNSGDLLAGKQIMVFCANRVLTITVAPNPSVVIDEKPKIQVSGPTEETAG